ncbi:hypothetical protein [Embleya sp. AB8]|uniref:hypothetical protein n=1 Tax=Embleya sp. AB8 TaxID=3156304 RepID=UPI003C71495B
MSKTAIIALLAEMNDADGSILARMRDELPAALRETEALPPALVRDALRRADEQALSAIAGNLGLPRGALAELYTGPVLPALRALRGLAAKNPRAYTEATRGVGELMDRHLGGSAAAWGRLLASLPTFDGPLPAAIEAAGAGEDPGEGVGDGAPGLRVSARLRVEFRQLLLLAPAEGLAELLPALPPYTVRDLIRFGAEVPADVLADVVARATPAQRRVLAAARHALPEVAGALLDLADPATNAAVYLNPRTGVALRARIMTGATPLHPTLVERVCNDWASTIRVPALWSGDPLLVRAALLGRRAVRLTLPECLAIWQEKGIDELRVYTVDPVATADGRAPQPFRVPRYRSVLLIALLRLSERAGAEAALELVAELNLPERSAAHLRELLSSPAGITRLRAEIARSTGARRLTRRLRGYLPALEWPMVETPVVDWTELTRAHRRRAFSARALALLAEQDGCPAELRRAASTAGRPAYGARLRGAWPTPVYWFDPRSRGQDTAAEHDYATALATGRVPIADLLTGPRAAPAAELLGRRDTIAPDARAGRRLRDELRELIDGQVAPTDRTAFAVVALRLLREFEGSLAELVTTSAAAVRG